jgi:hypothetical protein
MIKWIRIKKFCAETGETEDAVRSNISQGMWPEDIIWRKAPNKRIYLNTRNFNKWVEGQVYAGRQKPQSPSASNSEASGVVKDFASHRRRKTSSSPPA